MWQHTCRPIYYTVKNMWQHTCGDGNLSFWIIFNIKVKNLKIWSIYVTINFWLVVYMWKNGKRNLISKSGNAFIYKIARLNNVKATKHGDWAIDASWCKISFKFIDCYSFCNHSTCWKKKNTIWQMMKFSCGLYNNNSTFRNAS